MPEDSCDDWCSRIQLVLRGGGNCRYQNVLSSEGTPLPKSGSDGHGQPAILTFSRLSPHTRRSYPKLKRIFTISGLLPVRTGGPHVPTPEET